MVGVPLTSDQITARAITAVILAAAGLAILRLALAQAARWLLIRRRLATWETAWTLADSRWTRHD